MMEHEELTERIIGCAMKVHRVLGAGFLESVYQKAFAHELRKSELRVNCEMKLQVQYDGVPVGDFVADMVVNEVIIIENKAVQNLSTIHEVQLVNYLTATGINVGLLFNFGGLRLQFKRNHRLYE